MSGGVFTREGRVERGFNESRSEFKGERFQEITSLGDRLCQFFGGISISRKHSRYRKAFLRCIPYRTPSFVRDTKLCHAMHDRLTWDAGGRREEGGGRKEEGCMGGVLFKLDPSHSYALYKH